MVHVLSDADVDAQLSDPYLKDWHRDGDALLRTTFRAADFPTAVRIVDGIVVDSQKLHRNPDIDIRDRSLRFAVRSSGGITDQAVELCRRIEFAVGKRSGRE